MSAEWVRVAREQAALRREWRQVEAEREARRERAEWEAEQAEQDEQADG